MIPQIEQNDVAWVWFDSMTGLYVLECPICDVRRDFNDGDTAAFEDSFRYAPKYLVVTVNEHNRLHHGQDKEEHRTP